MSEVAIKVLFTKLLKSYDLKKDNETIKEVS